MCVQRVSLLCGGQFGTYFATLRADCVPNVHPRPPVPRLRQCMTRCRIENPTDSSLRWVGAGFSRKSQPMTDIEVVAISTDGRRLTVKADGSYAVLVRKSPRDKSFVGKIAGKKVSVAVTAAKGMRGG
jgi:hypothetical protein